MKSKITRTTKTSMCGFTLVELMITLVIVGVVTTVGVPSMTAFARNSAIKSESLDLMQQIAVARSEAIKRGMRVNLCRSPDPTAASPACGGADRTWTSGWIMFVAVNADDDFDAGTDILLGASNGSERHVQIRSNSIGNNYLEFNRDGTLSETGTARYAICDDRGEGFGRQINIPLVGRPFLVHGTAASPISDCDSPT